MIEITERAAKEIRRIVTDQGLGQATALRVGVKGGGCSGFSYTLGFDDQVAEVDQVTEVGDIRIVCGHWSTLGRFAGLGVHAIDTGCVWGGSLTALRLDSEEPEFVSIKSDRKPTPGKEQD